MSTVIAVFENIMAFTMEQFGWSRKKASVMNGVGLFVLSLPCALGFNIWSHIQPLGEGTGILDLEDFIVSNNLLPIGALIFALFCSYKIGWGWDNFIAEANEGKGIKFPKQIKFFVQYVIPAVMMVVFVAGYIDKFGG